ncbi:unnamed protein product, partial [Mesorhabditis belari]
MKPLTTGVGLRLMQKMGWRPGEGLGKDRIGDVEPLQLDVKFDRKGLAASTEQRGKKGGGVVHPTQQISQNVGGGAAWNPPDLGARNPISLLMEFAAKRRLSAPSFRFIEEGPPNSRRFNCAVIVNGVEYVPAVSSAQKKHAKNVCAQVALQALGIIRADPTVQ